MNMTYLLELPADRFVREARAYLQHQPGAGAAAAAEEAYFREVMLLSQPKIKSLEELPAYTDWFFTEDFPSDPKALAKVTAKGDPKARVSEAATALRSADFSSDAALEAVIKQTAAEHGLGFGDYQAPVRVALSGTSVGPNLTGMLRVLGRERVQRRLERFLASAP